MRSGVLPMLNAAGEVADKFEIISNLSISVCFKEKIPKQKLSRTSQNSTQSTRQISKSRLFQHTVFLTWVKTISEKPSASQI